MDWYFTQRSERKHFVFYNALLFRSSILIHFCLDLLGHSIHACSIHKYIEEFDRSFVSSHLKFMMWIVWSILQTPPLYFTRSNQQFKKSFMMFSIVKWLQCSPFWPVTDSLRMFIKHKDSVLSSCYFPFNLSHKTVLRMDKGVSYCITFFCIP